MKYNIDFLIAGLLFLILIVYHFKSQKQLNNQNYKIFFYFILLGMADIIFDIICTVLISAEDIRLVLLTKICLTVLYLLQVAVPYVLLLYTRSLRPGLKANLLNFWLAPALLMWTTILMNLKTGWFFYFDSYGIYTRGPWYMLMYYFALFYVSIVVVETIYYRELLGKEQYRVICEFLVIASLCICIQSVSNDFLVTGFGISLGITVLYLTINNPYEYTDNLTKLFNAQYFRHWLVKEKHMENPFHIITVDLHRVKQINNLWGNTFGDQFIMYVANGLSQISPTPYLFRLSGKRFLIVAPSFAEYEKVRDDVQAFFDSKFEIDGRQVVPSVVVCGILNANTLGNMDSLLAYVEYLSALTPSVGEYTLIQSDDKTMGGFRYNQEIENYLQTAIDNKMFEIYFQPLYSITEQQFISMESLTRLNHPRLGLVSPSVFIPLAEKNGSIIEIDLQQFRKVCQFLKENSGIMKQIKNVKFNMSPVELLSPGYSRKVIEIIQEFGLEYSYFHFEITETIATEYSSNLMQSLDDFLKAGIKICLDDFGSGYANLDAVLKLPFSTIKLDRSLLNNIGSDEQSRMFYQNIVRIFTDMGYHVVAEGVETEQEAKLVCACGVDLIQGFYYAKPMRSTDLIKVLERA